MTTARPRFTDVDDRKREGATYTPPRLAAFVADELVSRLDDRPRSQALRLLDPAVGQGALLVPLVERLRAAGFHHIVAHAWDADANALETAAARAGEHLDAGSFHCHHGDFLADSEDPSEPFDVVVANPPYVRTQVLGADAAQRLARRFGLRGRVDLHHAFVLAIADRLARDGLVGLIVSNRFMTTRAGAAVREALPRRVALEHVWDLGDTALFDAAVLPAVFVGRRTAPARHATARFTTVYTCDDDAEREVDDVIDALHGADGVVALRDGRRVRVRHGQLASGPRPRDVWRQRTASSERWLRQVADHTARTLGSLGRIRVGVKTTADRVFIRDDWPDGDDAPELLRPLLTHHAARRFRAEPPRRQILYPHRSHDGRCVPVDLADAPRAAAYLEHHRAALEARAYVREAGRRWYEVWCPQDPDAWAHDKLVFRDIAERPTFWIDDRGAIVNGDCYWLVPLDSVQQDWLYLALAVANATFCERFYDTRFNNRLYGRRRRFITQYMKHLPLPALDTAAAQRAVTLARELHAGEADDDAEEELDALVSAMFGHGGPS